MAGKKVTIPTWWLLIGGIIVFILIAFCYFTVAAKKVYSPPAPAASLETKATTQEDTDEKELLENLARQSVTGITDSDTVFTVSFQKRVDDYARLQAVATNKTLDPLIIIMRKTAGVWTIIDMGTTFPDLEQQIPELFLDY